MHDRGMIKWMPFNSVVNSKYIINTILKEKSKINKPVLSDEQIENLEQKIKESYINKVPLKIYIYQNGYITIIKGIVTKINLELKRLQINNDKYLYFCEIVKIDFELL